MTKYVCVTSVPDHDLCKEEMIVKVPDFIQDVIECRQHMPNTGVLSPSYVHALANHIGHKYDPEFTGSGLMVVNDLKGVPFNNASDIAASMVKFFRRYYPKIFDACIDYQIKNKPMGIKLVYFVGDHLDSSAFVKNGIDVIDLKDVDIYMGRKDKKFNKGQFKKTDAAE